MTRSRIVLILAGVCLASASAFGEAAAPLGALAKMPVKEITIFKDGHAFVLHEGSMPTDAAGNVVMDYLPMPVLGTFWPYSTEKDAKLTATVAGKQKVRVERTALSIRELLEANVGAEVIVTEKPAGKDAAGLTYPATILALPTRSGEELEATSPPNSGEKLPQPGSTILLKTAGGTKAVDIDRIQDVTFKKPHKPKVAQEEFRNLLTLKLGWPKAKPQKAAEVGIFYLQKGVRWIPHYKIVIDGKGNARLKLQATLVNELTDLTDVTAYLVVGVPTFAFEELVDPISLQQTFARLSEHFRRGSRGVDALSNVIMSQMAAPQRAPEPGPAPGADLGPEVGGAERSEDLFVYTVEHITLKKGQRMVLPVAEFALKYKDVYTLDIFYTPPPEVWRNFNSRQQADLAGLVAGPVVLHKIRMTNNSKYPLTTAPALVLSGQRVLAQGLLKYTAIGGDTDLTLTAAVDVNVSKTDKETKRTPNAIRWQGYDYGRIDLAGEIKITNHREHAVDLEVSRHVLGNVDEAGQDGKIEMVNVFEDASFAAEAGRPRWWGWYNWPHWWHHFNGVGRIRWEFALKAGKTTKLTYTWHYYWR